MGAATRGRFEERVLVLVGGHAMLEATVKPMLRARDAARDASSPCSTSARS